MPMLIPAATPIFSSFFMRRFHRMRHGNKASSTSMTPEYAGLLVSERTEHRKDIPAAATP